MVSSAEFKSAISSLNDLQEGNSLKKKKTTKKNQCANGEYNRMEEPDCTVASSE